MLAPCYNISATVNSSLNSITYLQHHFGKDYLTPNVVCTLHNSSYLEELLLLELLVIRRQLDAQLLNKLQGVLLWLLHAELKHLQQQYRMRRGRRGCRGDRDMGELK